MKRTVPLEDETVGILVWKAEGLEAGRAAG